MSQRSPARASQTELIRRLDAEWRVLARSRLLGDRLQAWGTDDERLLTTQQLAEYLAVPVSTLYSWRHAGEGPPGFRAGKHVRYRWSDVDKWVRSQLRSASRDSR